MKFKQHSLSLQDKQINEVVRRKLDIWIDEKKFCCNYPSISELAQDIGVSESQLSFYCSSELHQRFLSWRKRLRMEYAAELLIKEKQIPASAVGRMAGVNDKSDFRRQFIEVFAMTPEEWRTSRDDN